MADFLKGLKSGNVSLERINIIGLIVLLIGVLVSAMSQKIAKRFFPDKSGAAPIVKLVSLFICFAGFIITIYL